MVKEEKMIQMVSVNSSFIQEIGYISKTNELIVVLNSTHSIIYLYKDVPEEVYSDFINSDSKGAFFSQKIKGVYESSKKNCNLINSEDFYYNCDTNEIIDNRDSQIIPAMKKNKRKVDNILNKIQSLSKNDKLTDDKLNQLLEILGE